MSSILEALKKAESESPTRERVEMRAGRLALKAPPRPERRVRLTWFLLAAGVLAAAGAAAWFLKPGRTVSSSANVQSYRITARKNTPAREAAGQPHPGTPVQAPGTSRRATPPTKPAADRKPVRGPAKSAPAPRRRAAPAAVEPAGPPERPAAPAASRKTAPKKSAPPRTPVYQRSGHGLTLQAIAWDPDARKRFAVVNNQIVRQGQSVGGKVLERIAEDEIIVAQGGKRWKIEFRIE